MPDNELIESRMFLPNLYLFLFIPLLFHFLTDLTHGRYLIDICWKICICCHDQKNKSTSYLFFVFHVLYVGETFDWLSGRRWLCLLYFNYNLLENRYNINGVVSLLQMGTYQCLYPIKLYKLLSYHIIWQERAAHSLTIGIVWIVFFCGITAFLLQDYRRQVTFYFRVTKMCFPLWNVWLKVSIFLFVCNCEIGIFYVPTFQNTIFCKM